MMMFALTMAMGVLATPVAKEVVTTATTAAVASADQPAAKAKKYCIREALTGSRVQKTVCKTRTEWQATGFDPLVQ